MVNEDASLLFTRRQPPFTQKRSFSSHLHPIPEDLLVKSFHFANIPFHLWRRSFHSLVKFSPCWSMDCISFYSRFIRRQACFINPSFSDLARRSPYGVDGWSSYISFRLRWYWRLLVAISMTVITSKNWSYSQKTEKVLCSIYGISDMTFEAIWNSVFSFSSKRQAEKSIPECNGRRVLRIHKKSDFLLLHGSYRIIRNLNPAFISR